MSDMEDAASKQTPASSSPERRNTVDLVRVERGEPERRRLRRPSGTEVPDRRGAPDEG